MAYGHIYVVRHSMTCTTAITILQLKAGAATPFEVLRAWCNQRGSTTTQHERIQIVRKTAAATVTTAVAGTHVFKGRPGDPTPDLSLGTSATGVNASAEGTDGDVFREEGFNDLSGWEWLRSVDGNLIVPAAGIIGLKFPTAPPNNSQTWNFGMEIKELG